VFLVPAGRAGRDAAEEEGRKVRFGGHCVFLANQRLVCGEREEGRGLSRRIRGWKRGGERSQVDNGGRESAGNKVQAGQVVSTDREGGKTFASMLPHFLL